MTTTDYSTLGVYEVLQQLRHVKPDPSATELAADLVQFIAEHGDTIRRAREWLSTHEVATFELVDAIRSATGCDDSVDDGLVELVNQTSGADDVHAALMKLSRMVDPDAKFVPEAWA